DGSRRLRRMMEELGGGGLSPYLGSSLKVLKMPKRIDWKAVEEANQLDIRNFEDLLLVRGVGPSLLRALSLISEVVYGAPPSKRDPARYSFAFGGKDGVPYPVNIRLMEQAIEVLRAGILNSNIEDKDRRTALYRLSIMKRRFLPGGYD
ncbi:MAG: DUF763 domain-containing protein, partial [Thermoproteota archaeon]